jgi:hypothetical protein
MVVACPANPGLTGADQINKTSLEVTKVDDEVYSNMQELADDLPDHSPRFILLSYPLTLVRTIPFFPTLGPVAPFPTSSHLPASSPLHPSLPQPYTACSARQP